MVTTVAGTDNVSLQLYVDESDSGAWALKHSLIDTPGSWLSTSSSTVPEECTQNDGDTILRPGSASFLRTDGQDTTTEVHWREVMMMNSFSSADPTSSPTATPTSVRYIIYFRRAPCRIFLTLTLLIVTKLLLKDANIHTYISEYRL